MFRKEEEADIQQMNPCIRDVKEDGEDTLEEELTRSSIQHGSTRQKQQRKPIMERCCCWNSVRKGSFASGIFTLGFYIVVFTTCAFHVSNLLNEPWVFAFSLAMLLLSATCVVTSVLLIVALCADNKTMMIPWLISIFMTTIVDIILCIYLMFDMETDLWNTIFVVIDFLICVLNIYALVCVYCQYKEYSCGRGFAGQNKGTRYEAGLRGPEFVEMTAESGLRVTDTTSCLKTSFLTLPSPSK